MNIIAVGAKPRRFGARFVFAKIAAIVDASCDRKTPLPRPERQRRRREDIPQDVLPSDARRDGDARAFEHVAAESFTVIAKFRAVGVDEKAPLGRHRNTETELAQRWNEAIAARLKSLAPLLHNRMGFRFEARKRRPLGR